jgi:hypothetical protein
MVNGAPSLQRELQQQDEANGPECSEHDPAIADVAGAPIDRDSDAVAEQRHGRGEEEDPERPAQTPGASRNARPTICIERMNPWVSARPCSLPAPDIAFHTTSAEPGKAEKPPSTPPATPTKNERAACGSGMGERTSDHVA